jgi:hypothetical protein
MEQRRRCVENLIGAVRERRGVERMLKAVRWLVAATVVFQASATVGAHLSPPETFRAVRTPRAASGR